MSFEQQKVASFSPRSETRLIGQSQSIQALETDLLCAARSDAKVLVTGETGVGKEVVARLIHHRSRRSANPLVTVNCAGVPDSLLESELFGHTRGSFTGAYRDKPGLLEMAQNGTVFLDEVGEMSMRMQVVLLRFLETGEIQRIGAARPHTRVNVRLVTATNRDLQTQILSGAFREDLYFRLNVIRLTLPPLRERTEDIPLLVEHFLDLCSRQHRVPPVQMSPAAIDVLSTYRWPGNIRELRNVIERLVLKSNGRTVAAEDLPADVRRHTSPRPVVTALASAQPARRPVAEEMTRRMLERGESFWSVVYPEFMARDLTRDDLRKIVQVGLENTSGNYRLLTRLFGMPEEDYKRFLSFLRKHDCHLPFKHFRVARPASASPIRVTAAAV
jgi:transcriptional regulator with GAF, ATPase, and Fis domain